MTTDAPRPDEAPKNAVPENTVPDNAVPESDAPATDASTDVSEATIAADSPLAEPESSSAPEPPEISSEPETPVGETVSAGSAHVSTAEPTTESATAESTTAEPAAPEPTSPPPTESAPAVPAAPVSPEGSDESGTSEAKIQMQRSDDAAPVPSTGEITPAGSTEKVEIPSAEDVLDENLEAELEAALAGESKEPEPVSPNAEVAPVEEGDATGELTLGQKVSGTISSIASDNIIIDLGVRTAGILPARQFAKQTPEIGQKVNVVVDAINDEEGTAAVSLPGGARKPAGNWDGVAVGQVVDVLVKKINKGGLEVMVGGLRGFMPASQVDLGFVSDLDQFIGKKLTSKILEVNPQRRKLVVSRRALLAEERKEKEGELFETLEKGKTVTGTVKSIKDFGAFVDLGGADGLLHIGQISWSRINHPSDVLEVGQEVEVQIMEVDGEKKKISLSMRQLQSNPWSLAEQNYPVGSPVSGTVSRVADFGAFVKLEPGVEGLIHISQLDHTRVRAVGDVVCEGQEVEAKILEVDTNRRRISLSLKAMTTPAEDPAELEAEQQAEERRRRRKPRGDLRGGTGGSGNGGLFGNPNDFG